MAYERPCACRRRKRLHRHGARLQAAGRRSFRDDPPIDEVIDTVFNSGEEPVVEALQTSNRVHPEPEPMPV